jgi:hypothetical protein
LIEHAEEQARVVGVSAAAHPNGIVVWVSADEESAWNARLVAEAAVEHALAALGLPTDAATAVGVLNERGERIGP